MLQMADKCIPQFLSRDAQSSCNRMLTMLMYDIHKDARVPESCPSTLRYFSNCSSPLRGLGIKLYHMHIMVCLPKLAKTLWREQSVGLYVLLRIYYFWSRDVSEFFIQSSWAYNAKCNWARLSLCLDPGFNTCYKDCHLQACLFLIIFRDL